MPEEKRGRGRPKKIEIKEIEPKIDNLQKNIDDSAAALDKEIWEIITHIKESDEYVEESIMELKDSTNYIIRDLFIAKIAGAILFFLSIALTITLWVL